MKRIRMTAVGVQEGPLRLSEVALRKQGQALAAEARISALLT